MKNFLMIFVEIVRMPVFFVYCIFVWLSRIDSNKVFKCFITQFFIQLSLFSTYAIFSKEPNVIIGVTMIIVIILTLVVGYFIIGCPKTEKEWNYIFTPIKIINLNVKKEYENKNNNNNNHDSTNIKESLDERLADISYRDTDESDSTIHVEVDIKKDESEQEDIITDEDVSNMLMSSFNAIIENVENEPPKDDSVLTEEILEESNIVEDDIDYIDDEDEESYDLDDIDVVNVLNDDEAEIEAIAVKNNSNKFNIESENSENNGPVLTSAVPDDEEI